MDFVDVEVAVCGLYRKHGFEPDRPPTAFELARAMDVVVDRPHAMVGSLARAFIGGGHRRVALKRSLAPERAHFALAHELGHLELGERCGSGELAELRANHFAARAIMTEEFVREMIRQHGPRAALEIAEHLCVTQTAAHLSVGEVRFVAVAVVSQRDVRTRGPEYVWPAPEVIHRYETKRPPTRLAKTRITDEPGRFVLRPKDVA